MRYPILMAVPVLLVTLLASSLAPAQTLREERVRFAAGTTGTTIEDRLSGDEIVDYRLRAEGGQSLHIGLDTRHGALYFNLLQGDDPVALHIGSRDGHRYRGILPDGGDYRIRVYLMRSAARRDEAAAYRLTIDIAPRDPDFADGLSGGPDVWDVAHLTAGDTLNLRAGPGTAHAVVGALANGDRVRNLGCEMAGGARWCRVETLDIDVARGWVNGRYLVESHQVPGRQASGRLPCATSLGQPTGSCAFRVTRGAGGNASVWIALPDGGERYIEFREGRPVGTDPGLSLSAQRRGDLTLIRIGEVERYEIPDAIVHGG